MARNTYEGHTGQNMISPLVFSLVFHLVIFFLLTIGLPYVRPKTPVTPEAITIEFIQADTKEQKQKKTPPKKNNKPQSAPKNTAEKPPTLKTVKKPVEKPDVVKKPVPETPITKPKITEKPKTKPKPKKKEKPKKESVQQENQFSSLLKNLQESENLRKQEEETPEKVDPNETTRSLADQITTSEMSVVSDQISGCWYAPSGAKDAKNLIVDIHIIMNPDRTIRSAQIMDTARYNQDSFFKATADSALRAIRNPGCSPLMLPPNKYDQWKSFIFQFDPSEML